MINIHSHFLSFRKSSSLVSSAESRRLKEPSITSTQMLRPRPPKPLSPKKDLHLASEITLEMPDHINKGKTVVTIL